eukprot:scaffold8498_cov105-Isochrysis_galbana.AAC.6
MGVRGRASGQGGLGRVYRASGEMSGEARCGYEGEPGGSAKPISIYGEAAGGRSHSQLCVARGSLAGSGSHPGFRFLMHWHLALHHASYVILMPRGRFLVAVAARSSSANGDLMNTPNKSLAV